MEGSARDELFMKATTDSIFKVCFGIDLDNMSGPSEEGDSKDAGTDRDLIGQFGVIVSTKNPKSDKQYVWEGEANSSSYIVRQDTDHEKLIPRGTSIKLHLKSSSDRWLGGLNSFHSSLWSFLFIIWTELYDMSKFSFEAYIYLAAVFKKIGEKQTCSTGPYELYRLTQLYPKVDILSQLQNPSEAFRTYIRDGLAQRCLLVVCWLGKFSSAITRASTSSPGLIHRQQMTRLRAVFASALLLAIVFLERNWISLCCDDAFRLINPQTMMLGQEPRQSTFNLCHLNKPSIQTLIQSFNSHYYSIAIKHMSLSNEPSFCDFVPSHKISDNLIALKLLTYHVNMRIKDSKVPDYGTLQPWKHARAYARASNSAPNENKTTIN
ncbi:heat shock protein 89.1 [Tanacetum coccineum]